MTEEEAKMKWCPFFRQSDGRYYFNNRPNADHRANCIGSACMAWRWSMSPQQAEAYQEAPTDPGGYCGLAGTP